MTHTTDPTPSTLPSTLPSAPATGAAPAALLVYPLGDTLPESGRAIEVAPGVRWLRMALPFALNHINLWLLRDRLDGPYGPVEGWTVVDCCIDRPESRAQWEQVFADELQGLPVLRVIVTHMHPDHVGLAHWLCQRWSTPAWECRLWISASDYYVARLGVDGQLDGAALADYFSTHGMRDPEHLAQVRQRSRYFPSLVPAMPRTFHRLQEGDTLRIGGRDWHCVGGYGHAPEHIALHCPQDRLLISGDMLLPTISTNVSVYDSEPEANPLPAFLDSIDRYRVCDPDTLVLPSHGRPFNGAHARIEQLHAHHRERLDDLLQACRGTPRCALELLPVLFKRALDLHQTTFALGETVAHLHALWYAGRLRRTRDAEGVWRFVATD